MKQLTAATAIALVITAAGPIASAQTESSPPKDQRPTLVTPYGMSVSVGGGVTGFIDSSIRGFTDPGGSWDARFAFGTRERVAVEVAYIGTAQAIDALGIDSDSILVGNGVETAARVNFYTGDVQPYVLGGVGWKRYDITRTDRNTSSLLGEDNVLEVPIGMGVSYRYYGLVVDGRAVARPTIDSDLIDAAVTNSDIEGGLHNVSVQLMAGWEF